MHNIIHVYMYILYNLDVSYIYSSVLARKCGSQHCFVCVVTVVAVVVVVVVFTLSLHPHYSLPPLPPSPSLSLPLPPSLPSLTLPHMFEVHTPERVFHLSAPSEDEMQSWVGMLQTLKLYARQHSPTQGGGEPVPNVSAANAILHQAAVENGAAKSQNEEWTDTTLPTSTGSSVPTQEKQNEELSATVGAAVQKRYKEKEKDPTNGVANGSVTATRNGRPRSQA